MKTEFYQSFSKDLKKLKERDITAKVKKLIETVKQTENISELQNLKKLRGAETYYRIRVGDYRVGLIIEDETAHFVRCLHRKDIYRFFP